MPLDPTDQAARDMIEWVMTLDADEAVGELGHLGDSLDSIMNAAQRGEVPPQTAIQVAATVAMVAGTIGQHLRSIHSSTRPKHSDGDLHSCTLIERMIVAAS